MASLVLTIARVPFSLVASPTLAQNVTDTQLVIDMAGVNSSLVVIDMAGMGFSRQIITPGS